VAAYPTLRKPVPPSRTIELVLAEVQELKETPPIPIGGSAMALETGCGVRMEKTGEVEVSGGGELTRSQDPGNRSEMLLPSPLTRLRKYNLTIAFSKTNTKTFNFHCSLSDQPSWFSRRSLL
jgi:hypothetical protein